MSTSETDLAHLRQVHTEKLRRYEQCHSVWMNTSVFTAAGAQAKADLNTARQEYTQAETAYSSAARCARRARELAR